MSNTNLLSNATINVSIYSSHIYNFVSYRCHFLAVCSSWVDKLMVNSRYNTLYKNMQSKMTDTTTMIPLQARLIGHLEAGFVKITTEPSNALCSTVATVSFVLVYPACVASGATSPGNHTYFTFRWANLHFERALNCTLVKVGALNCT